ncbi:hypothetical protein [Cohnella laeviribosi]|uniref:hypothetical protein n=1 Tax=Cohnella laeviribosi TaxID=380174 RepID=UPI000373FDBE|nr:hypothetical protein [Cohnella laeviribosi]
MDGKRELTALLLWLIDIAVRRISLPWSRIVAHLRSGLPSTVKAKREESSSSQPAAHPARSHPSIRATPPTPEPAKRETASVSDSSEAADSTDAMSRLLAAKKRNRR